MTGLYPCSSVDPLRASMDRPNIALEVVPVRDMEQKLQVLLALMRQFEGSGILYCATRDNTEIVAGFLADQGVDAVAYHAGYEPEKKRGLQEAFVRGGHKVIAATNALGMGIDKPDIRFIVHVDVPGSITAYYQEVGRAGRDGKPATGVLLYCPGDRRIQEHFIGAARPTTQDFETVLRVLADKEASTGLMQGAVKARSGLHPTKVTVILAELAEQGLIEKVLSGRRQVYRRTGATAAPELKRYDRQYEVRTRELEAMLRYGRGEVECLMHELRTALGDEASSPCGRCSLCEPRAEGPALATSSGFIGNWLSGRTVPIRATRRPVMSEGLALLDGPQRTALFVQFMRKRAACSAGIPQELETLLLRGLDRLQRDHDLWAVVPLPSRTWAQRDAVARRVAGHLGVAVLGDALVWAEVPPKRQGELLNNDQRRENVKGRMTAKKRFPPTDRGAVLLLDDYLGSGSTLKEAVRALRQDGGVEAAVVPLTLARVQWRLGAPGLV